jgi:hypothetical protein
VDEVGDLGKRAGERPKLAAESVRTGGVRREVKGLVLVIDLGANVTSTHGFNDTPLHRAGIHEVRQLRPTKKD